MKERLNRPKLLIPGGELDKRITPYFEKAGITQSLANPRSLEAYTNAGVMLVKVRASDTPAVLSMRLPNVIGGIAGSDSFLEWAGELYPGVEIPVYDPDERRPRIALAATDVFIEERGGNVGLEDFAGTIVTTTVPHITQRAFEEAGMRTVVFPEVAQTDDEVTIFPVGGKTEAIPLLSANNPGVVDVVDSGKTLEANGLQVIQELHTVSVRLVVSAGISEENMRIFEDLEKKLTKN